MFLLFIFHWGKKTTMHTCFLKKTNKTQRDLAARNWLHKKLKIPDQHFLYELLLFYGGRCFALLEHKVVSVMERGRNITK